ncbi:hypothetical protein EXW26_26360 [Bacillus mycoides]|uniref:CgeB family protein n=1 Tax=Bacillus mycoides TaxID=1405 RepID=UPI001C034D4D|nr:glycosyltransferase [Bacillus mycoides]QWG58717.1 hypothetical protein EXW26_26360 [Bacillus mycoides]
MKLFLVGPDFYDYNTSLASAFSNNKFQTKVMSYQDRNKNVKETLENRIFPKIGIYKYQRDNLQRFNDEFVEEVLKYRPTVLVVIKGDCILKDSLLKIKRAIPEIKCVLWMMDSLSRFPKALESLEIYYKVVYFEEDDKKYFEDVTKGIYIPMGYNSNIYQQSEEDKDIDICFAGYGYPKRKEILNELAKQLCDENLKIIIIGEYGNKRRPLTHMCQKIKYRYLYKVLKNHTVTPEELNRLYNRSKICLNINFEGHHGINPRTFEIAATNSFQLTDFNKGVTSFYDIQEDIIVFEEVNDLVKKVRYYLKNEKERKRIANNAYEKTVNKQSMENRVEEFLKQMNNRG